MVVGDRGRDPSKAARVLPLPTTSRSNFSVGSHHHSQGLLVLLSSTHLFWAKTQGRVGHRLEVNPSFVRIEDVSRYLLYKDIGQNLRHSVLCCRGIYVAHLTMRALEGDAFSRLPTSNPAVCGPEVFRHCVTQFLGFCFDYWLVNGRIATSGVTNCDLWTSFPLRILLRSIASRCRLYLKTVFPLYLRIRLVGDCEQLKRSAIFFSSANLITSSFCFKARSVRFFTTTKFSLSAKLPNWC